MKQIPDAKPADSRWQWLYRVSGVAALILGVLFLLAILSIIVADLRTGTVNGRFSLFENNWLVVLFKLNAGYDGVQFDQLYGLKPLDIALMVLVATVYLGLCVALRQASKIWCIIAAVIPFLGIVLFIATKLAGRSGVMAAGLIISLLMLRSNTFGRVVASMGILANVLLLVGDFGTATDSPSNIIATLVGVGYVLLVIWIFLTGRRLFQLGQVEVR